MTWSAGTGCLEFLRVRTPWDRRQEDILEELFHATTHPWFVTAEDLPPEWTTVAENTSRLPSNLDAWAFLNTTPIPHGAWLLHAAPGPRAVRELPDVFRASAPTIHAWLERQGVAILVASWPDDVDWRIFVRPTIAAES